MTWNEFEFKLLTLLDEKGQSDIRELIKEYLAVNGDTKSNRVELFAQINNINTTDLKEGFIQMGVYRMKLGQFAYTDYDFYEKCEALITAKGQERLKFLKDKLNPPIIQPTTVYQVIGDKNVFGNKDSVVSQGNFNFIKALIRPMMKPIINEPVKISIMGIIGLLLAAATVVLGIMQYMKP